MTTRFATKTLITVLLNCAVVVWCVWRARDDAPPDASWWPMVRLAAGAAATLTAGCGIVLMGRGVSWLLGHPAPHAGRPGDS